MKQIHCGLVSAIALVSIQCSDASAPDVDEPTINPPGPIISPPGRITFVTEVSPGNGALYVVNGDGTGLRQLHAGPTYYSRPRWSPDRRRIAFSRMDLNSLVSGIFVIDVDGPEGLVRLADGTDPAWSPDGSKIAFVANGVGGPGIHLMNADGSNVRRLTSPNNAAQCNEGSSASDWKPDWSPDGRMILFERQIHIDDNWDYDCGLDGYGYVSNVYVMNADGTGVRRLRSVPWTTGDADPAWSPDGRSIAYAVHHSTLFTIDSNGTGPEEAIFWDIAGVPFTPSWSADGRKLLVLCTRPPLAVPPNNFLVIVDLAARSTQVLSFPSVPGLIHDPAWAR